MTGFAMYLREMTGNSFYLWVAGLWGTSVRRGFAWY